MQIEQLVDKQDLPSDFSQMDSEFTPLSQELQPVPNNDTTTASLHATTPEGQILQKFIPQSYEDFSDSQESEEDALDQMALMNQQQLDNNEQERHMQIAQRMYESIYQQKQPCSDDEDMMGDDEDSIQDEDIDRYLENEQPKRESRQVNIP